MNLKRLLLSRTSVTMTYIIDRNELFVLDVYFNRSFINFIFTVATVLSELLCVRGQRPPPPFEANKCRILPLTFRALQIFRGFAPATCSSSYKLLDFQTQTWRFVLVKIFNFVIFTARRTHVHSAVLLCCPSVRSSACLWRWWISWSLGVTSEVING